MYVISENIIAESAIRFLRNHYKSRNQVGLDWEPLPLETGETETASLEQVEKALGELRQNLHTKVQRKVKTPNGLVADALLTFFQKDNQPFQVAVEASSYHKLEEVQFVPQPHLLAWDSIALSLLGTTGLFLLSYAVNSAWIQYVGFWGACTVLWIVFFSAYFGFQHLLRPLSRYRYIFAIEQFKQYYANEQWVAVGADLFEELGKEYFRELKRQCIYNGMGLLVVNAELQTRLVLSPSRVDLFRNRRPMAQFLPSAQVERMEYLSQRVSRGYKRIWQYLEKFLPQRSQYQRFRRTYYHQMGISAACLAVLAGLLLYEYNNRPIKVVNEKRYVRKMEKEADQARPETREFFLDTSNIQPFVTVDGSYLDLSAGLYETWDLGTNIAVEAFEDRVELVIQPNADTRLVYDCSRLHVSQRLYYVSPGAYSTLEQTLEVSRRIQAWGIPCHFFWRPCFKQGAGYQLFVRYFFTSKKEANEWQEQLSSYCQRNHIRGLSFSVFHIDP